MRRPTCRTLTDGQIKQTVANMEIADADKAIILRRALAGEPEARFVVLAAYVKQADHRSRGWLFGGAR